MMEIIQAAFSIGEPVKDFYDTSEARRMNRALYRDMDLPERKYFVKRKPRIIIYPKDIEAMYDRSARFARHLLQTIREKYGKEKHQPVTIKEFCEYTAMSEETVHDFIMES